MVFLQFIEISQNLGTSCITDNLAGLPSLVFRRLRVNHIDIYKICTVFDVVDAGIIFPFTAVSDA